MQRGTLAHYLRKEKEMSIAQDILKELSKQNLTVGQVKIILELAQWLTINAKFSGLVPQNTDGFLPKFGEDTSHSGQ